MSNKIHKFFTRKCADWNILDFLEECSIEEYKKKVEAYLTSLEIIANTKKDIRSEQAQELLDKYKKANTLLLHKQRVMVVWQRTSSPVSFKSLRQATKLMLEHRKSSRLADVQDFELTWWDLNRKEIASTSIYLQNSTFEGTYLGIGIVNGDTFNAGLPTSVKRYQKENDYNGRDKKRQCQTRSGRSIPNYENFFAETSSQEELDKDGNNLESPIQENEETRSEMGLDVDFCGNLSQENEETRSEMGLDVDFCENLSQENEETRSEMGLDVDFCENLSQENNERKHIQDSVLTDILGNIIDYSDTTKEIFSIYKKQNPDEWHCEIDDLRSPEQNDPMMTAVVQVIHHTLPQFIKAFSLEDQNPLLNITTIEGAHLNSFVHPCFDAFLWYIANIHYEYDANKHQLIYVEGTRPTVKDDKEIADLEKITNNLKNMFGEQKAPS
ncbi:2431_t:CDS:2 [Entrophospora sp. SA101]|nr:2431_t:CDS:2 [Entrophospora sp. SA101]